MKLIGQFKYCNSKRVQVIADISHNVFIVIGVLVKCLYVFIKIHNVHI